LALLDERFAAAAARWPSIAARVVERTMRRTQILTTHLAVVCLPGLELRLYALFWHLADRFGRVEPDGVIVPIRLTHETLARLANGASTVETHTQRPRSSSSLLAGVSRTAYAMASNRELPHWLAAVHPHYRVPHHAELAIGLIVVVVVAVADVRSAIGFSSFAVLLYYAVANASALTLRENERRWPRWIPAVGLVGCVTLALALPRAQRRSVRRY